MVLPLSHGFLVSKVLDVSTQVRNIGTPSMNRSVTGSKETMFYFYVAMDGILQQHSEFPIP